MHTSFHSLKPLHLMALKFVGLLLLWSLPLVQSGKSAFPNFSAYLIYFFKKLLNSLKSRVKKSKNNIVSACEDSHSSMSCYPPSLVVSNWNFFFSWRLKDQFRPSSVSGNFFFLKLIKFLSYQTSFKLKEKKIRLLTIKLYG